jgi:mono/diheme cytochrome c family protein
MDALVKVVQRLTGFVAAAFVVLLFVNEPAKPAPVPAVGTANAGQAIFSARCASCHGADGGGGFGPALRGGVVVAAFPDPAAQVTVVRGGRGSMPSFEGSLTPEQLAAVVEYTRTGLR